LFGGLKDSGLYDNQVNGYGCPAVGELRIYQSAEKVVNG
jgi:hypothetical protein